MNKPSLSHIFRNGTRSAEGVLDAEAILALANGQQTADADRIHASIAHRDLIRFARDLQNESAALSTDVALAFAAEQPAHRRSNTSQRSAHGQRRWRIASAVAATFVAAIAIWSSHRVSTPAPSTTATAATARAPDHIFAAFDDRAMANNNSRADDRIFHADFVPDEIFNSRHNDG
ncbi:MAG: hypothetical protein ABJB01_00045 [Rudaea sp.]